MNSELYQNIVTVLVTVRRVLNWMTEFIDTLYTVLGATGNYCAIAYLHTSQFTVAHTLGFSVFTSRILVTDLSHSLTVTSNHT
jgi:hypothetical protein